MCSSDLCFADEALYVDFSRADERNGFTELIGISEQRFDAQTVYLNPRNIHLNQSVHHTDQDDFSAAFCAFKKIGINGGTAGCFENTIARAGTGYIAGGAACR